MTGFLYFLGNTLRWPVLKPKVRIYGTGIMRITRHPQAFGQIIWCFAHTLWIGTSFTLITSIGLILHHLFAIWHGDKRLANRFGEEFEEFKKNILEISEEEILQKIKDRNTARDNKNYQLADEIRDELLDKGILIEDKDDKTTWKIK